MPLGTEVSLGPDNIMLDGDTAPLPKKGVEPLLNFGPYLLWPNGWMDQDGTWHEGGPCLGHIVLDGDPAPLPKRGQGQSPQLSAHFYCGQTTGWIKMPLGTKVGLGPGDIVLGGDPTPSKKEAKQPLLFGPCLL